MVRRIVGWALLAASGAAAFGQTAVTEQSIAARVQGAFVLLRGMYDGDKLAFDSQGRLIGSATPIPFALSFVKVEQVHLTQDNLEILATREGLAIQQGREGRPDRFRAEPIGKKSQMDVTIARDPRQDDLLITALDRVFYVGFDDGLAQTAPHYWRPWIMHELHPERPFPEIPVGVERPTGPGKKAGAVLAGRLVHSVDAMTTQAARAQRLSGQSTVNVVVDDHGVPREVTIVRPIGMGLDEMAILAVLQFRFTPAMKDGQPVPVAVNVEVNFRI